MRSILSFCSVFVLVACGAPDFVARGGGDAGVPRGDASTAADAAPLGTDDAGSSGDAGAGGDAARAEGDAGSVSDAGAAGCAPACDVGTVCVAGACVASLTGDPAIDGVLLGDGARFDTEILVSQDPDLSWRPSRIYRFRDFAQAVATMYGRGVGDMHLFLGDPADPEPRRSRMALVNLAAFLAQAMKETIRYDACDENNWDSTNGYQISNACGQLGQDYGSYDCALACPHDPTASMTAVTHASWYGAPGPFFCAPDATLASVSGRSDGRTGHWDYGSDCWPYPATQPGFVAHDGAPAWTRPDCEVYAGQRAGRWVWDGSGGSVADCCWWGRGVIQTTGRCNFGMLDHYLGAGHAVGAAAPPRPVAVLYPDVDFCSDPEAICSSTSHPELKWVAGLFYWMSSVQSFDSGGWRYLDRLAAFVDGGMTDDAFIDAVSGIVNRGCPASTCATGPVDGLDERRVNFDRVLRVMGLR